MIASTLVTDEKGGVIMIGGDAKWNSYLNTLWYLPDSKARWRRLPQTLSVGRHYHIAFFIPDEIAEICNNN
jgi:hypothetical protein